MAPAPAPALGDSHEVERRVLEIVASLSHETSGPRALAVGPSVSLERELGLGSLERAELLSRLEKAFGRRLDESLLRADTPGELAAALGAAPDSARNARAQARPHVPLGVADDLGSFGTICQALWRRAETSPDRPHVYLREDDGRELTLTYADLFGLSRRVGGGLRARGIGRGDTVGLMLPTGQDFLAAFQGILAVGAVPVPIYPPARLDRLQEYLERQSGILADASVRGLVTIPRAVAIAKLLRSRVPSLDLVVTAGELATSGEPLEAFTAEGCDPAFIQYTSGSTGAPKGVLLTHENLLANIKGIELALQIRPDDVGVIWLPLYHDMGLIGSWLFCLCRGVPIDIQSPLSFLARPERWLWAIHRRRGTLSAAPNFAYELCVRKIRDEDIEGLDLSSWRCALNGAEPVSPATLDRFASRFAGYGFRREALMPVYGLAENAVGLCLPPPGRGPRIDRVARRPFEDEGRAEPAAPEDAQALLFASEGVPLADHEVRIVDDEGTDLPERRLGRLIFRGPSMMAGYFRKPEATAAITLPGGWLDSGDLAYVAGGEIHIAGRRKDLIIKGGRNVVPHEVEDAAAGVEGVRAGCVVALGVVNDKLGTESLVVVAEVRPTAGDHAAIEAAIRARVDDLVGMPPDVVVLVEPGAVSKTSSGKIRRAATRQMYLAGTLGRPAGLGFADKVRLARGALQTNMTARISWLGQRLYAACLVTAFALAAVVAWPLAWIVPNRRFMSGLERACLRYVLFVAGIKTSVQGLEHLDTPGPMILASNHTSYADIPVLRALISRPFVFVAKKEAVTWPLVGLFLRKAGHIMVDRGDATQSVASTAQVLRALERGERVLLFPEATFTAADGLRPFKLGAFKIAIDAGVPVIPLALRGTRRILRDGTWIPRRLPASLWVGAPIRGEGSTWSDIVTLRDRVADSIAAHCGEPRLDLVAAGAPRPS